MTLEKRTALNGYLRRYVIGKHRDMSVSTYLWLSQVFKTDLNRLLAMDDMWTVPGRVRPVPLDYVTILDGRFDTPPLRTSALQANGSTKGGRGEQQSNGVANGHASGSTTPNPNGCGNGDTRILKDQMELTLKENLQLFVDR